MTKKYRVIEKNGEAEIGVLCGSDGKELTWNDMDSANRWAHDNCPGGYAIEEVKDTTLHLSVLVPGIRTKNWQKLYDSVKNSFSGNWEMIFIGPYAPPQELQQKPNTKWICDWGTPIRCQQIGLIHANGQYITWAADDGEYLPGALDIGWERLREYKFDKRVLVMGKYYEGNGENSHMAERDYYYLSNHDASLSDHLPGSYLMLNVGIVSTELLREIGGWDCQFEVCPMAYNDLAVRLQNDGVKFLIQNEMMFKCDHMPGTTGDHGPIHYAQLENDQPLFKKIYSKPNSIYRKTIDIENWKNSPERWERRWGKKDE